MPVAIDHLLVVVHDLEAAVRDFQALGFTIQQRDDSIEGSMINRFICFADGSYILLSAFAQPEQAKQHRLAPFLARGEGWADYSFVVDDVAGVAHSLENAGLSMRGPIRVANTLASGEEWSLDLLLTGVGAQGDGALPFLVEDKEGRDKRIPIPVPHENGASGIVGLRLAVRSAQSVADSLETMLGGRLALQQTEIEGRIARRIEFDNFWLEIVEDLNANGGLPGLYEAVLSSDRGAKVVDGNLVHGASLRFA